MDAIERLAAQDPRAYDAFEAVVVVQFAHRLTRVVGRTCHRLAAFRALSVVVADGRFALEFLLQTEGERGEFLLHIVQWCRYRCANMRVAAVGRLESDLWRGLSGVEPLGSGERRG